MRFLVDAPEKERAEKWLKQAADVAREATCQRARCGTVIVAGGEVIGRGFNSPPAGLESQRRCRLEKSSYHPRVTDKTCCVHAEQRAIMDAFRRYPEKLAGARLYFIRLGEDGHKAYSGQPYCTMCSKMALDSGVAEFVLWHEEGICVYGTEEYNDLSYKYQDGKDL